MEKHLMNVTYLLPKYRYKYKGVDQQWCHSRKLSWRLPLDFLEKKPKKLPPGLSRAFPGASCSNIIAIPHLINKMSYKNCPSLTKSYSYTKLTKVYHFGRNLDHFRCCCNMYKSREWCRGVGERWLCNPTVSCLIPTPATWKGCYSGWKFMDSYKIHQKEKPLFRGPSE